MAISVRAVSLYLDSPLTGDVDPSFYTPTEIVLTELRAVIRGGTSPSVAWTIRYAADRSAAGTEVVTGGTTSTNTTTGDAVTSLDAATVPAGSWVWIELGTVSTGADAPDAFTVALL